MFDYGGDHSHMQRPWCTHGFLPQLLLTVLLAGILVVAYGGAVAHANQAPVAAYSFDEGSGTTVKDSAGNHDGTINGATWTAAGKYGSALDFDGVNDLVSIADAADLDLTNSFTLEAWIRPDTLAQGKSVISKVETPASPSGYLLTAQVNGKPTGYAATSGTVKGVSGSSALSTGTWTDLAFTSDGTTLRLYVDGKLTTTAPAIAAKATAADLEIGHSVYFNNAYFDGLIDEVRLYNQALPESQIQTDRDTAVGLDQMPVAAYSFDEGSGTTVKDSAGNHDGTINGATWTAAGKYGSALDFDGVNDLVSIADAADLDLTNSFTLEAWIRPDSLTAPRPVISKAESSGGNSGYLLSAKYATNSAGYVANSGSSAEASSPTALPTGTWSHLAVTSDGANLRLYVGGQLVVTKPAIAAKATNANLEIGHSVLGGYFDGLIDEVRIYNEPLPESQIQVDRDNRVKDTASTEVTTSMMSTGPNSELVPSVPIASSNGIDTAVYSLAIPSIKAGEVLRTTGNLEVTNTHTYDVTDTVRLVLGSSPSDSNGTIVTPWTSVQQTPEMLHWTLPINGVYRAPSDSGSTQYLKVILKASSVGAKSGDTLVVEPNFGHLAATRYTPVIGPMSQPTHQLQTLVDIMPEQISSVPVDSAWRRVLSRRVSSLSANDILDLTGQLEVQNTTGTSVQMESKITMTTAPSSANGSTASPVTVDRLTSGMTFGRIVQSNQLKISDAGKRYVNLLVRAVPTMGSPKPVTVTAGRAMLNVVRLKPNLGDPTASLREGTLQELGWDIEANVTSIPFCAGGCQKRVVASAPLYGGLWKGEVIRARGVVTGDLNGGNAAQVLTRLIVASSPTETSGDEVAALSGDKVSTGQQIHTSVKEGTYVVPKAEQVSKYLNFVVYASRAPAYEGEAMNVPSASISLTRSKPTLPFKADFEDGLLNQLFPITNDGVASVTSTVAREGSKSLEVNLDLSHSGEDPLKRRRVEFSVPDKRTSGGYYGEEGWYGFSAYFPKDFVVPRPDNPEATAGTWNIFAQWHGEPSGDGLDCTLEAGQVPIAFNVRYRKAGSYKNPGATETSTPVDGDYLEMEFEGGELNESCSSNVKPTQRYVVGLLERGTWYDFVLHTRWTQLSGGPGDSISEVWIDGKQVLGNQSTPVTTPTLLWHGTPEIHSNQTYLKFGLYRGPSEEDPKTKLYIDSFKRGNSYSQVAPGQ